MRPITRKRTPSAGTAGSRGAARAPTRSGRGQGGAPRSSGAARPRARGPAAARRLPPMGSAPRRRHGWPARRAPLPPDTCSPLLRPRRLPPAALLRPTARRGRAPAGRGGGNGGRGKRWRLPPVRGRREGNCRQRPPRAAHRRPTCAWWGFLSQAPAKSRLAMAITHPRSGRRTEAERSASPPGLPTEPRRRLDWARWRRREDEERVRHGAPSADEAAAVSGGDAPCAGRTTGRGETRPPGSRGARARGGASYIPALCLWERRVGAGRWAEGVCRALPRGSPSRSVFARTRAAPIGPACGELWGSPLMNNVCHWSQAGSRLLLGWPLEPAEGLLEPTELRRAPRPSAIPGGGAALPLSSASARSLSRAACRAAPPRSGGRCVPSGPCGTDSYCVR